MPKKDADGRHVFPRDHQILFPFEEDPETEGMWWELEHRKKRWRTVSGKTYDPEDWASCDDTEPQSDDDASNALGTQTAEEDETGIENTFSGLIVHDTQARIEQGVQYESQAQLPLKMPRILGRRSERILLCFSNFFKNAHKLLLEAADAAYLANIKGVPDDKPLLLAVVEEGHKDVVELLIDHEAELESRDRDGNTTLLRALNYGRGILAEILVAAGANISVSNNDGKTVCDTAQASFELQKESIRIEKMIIHPREPPLVRVGINKDRVQKNIHTRRERFARSSE
ncbi:uncharacterized protein RHO25_002943 [Cercospora beticola]|uniref:Uncharacterized protein n=2 Tax=Cercospora beticola TaxID=122368 RepID=A0ABZ0NFQ7_CERBT|nr:hypothetical protein RHO25_002943 [Cercospora beticola]